MGRERCRAEADGTLRSLWASGAFRQPVSASRSCRGATLRGSDEAACASGHGGHRSGIWFAFLTFIAYRAGSNWDVLYATIVRSGKIVAIAATALVIVAAAIFYLRRRKQAQLEP
jgi:hypothetical protein